MLSRIRNRASGVVDPVARGMVKAGFSPNSLTVLGLVVGLLAAWVFARGDQLVGSVLLLLGGGLDVVDGAVARASGRVTRFGGVLDSTLDRYVDFAVLAGIVYGGLAEVGYLPGWLWGVLAISGSFLVSYVRARAEAAGSGKLDVGIAERGERVLILAICGFLSRVGYGVVLVAVLAHFTVLHRLWVARQRLR